MAKKTVPPRKGMGGQMADPAARKARSQKAAAASAAARATPDLRIAWLEQHPDLLTPAHVERLAAVIVRACHAPTAIE